MNPKFFCKIFFIVLAMLSISFANGATVINAPNAHASTEPSTTVTKIQIIKAHPVPVFQVWATVLPGSLKANIQRIVRPYGWTVAWDVHYDFNFVGKVQIRSSSIEGILQALLANYPLQAVFFQGNHVVEIRSRIL